MPQGPDPLRVYPDTYAFARRGPQSLCHFSVIRSHDHATPMVAECLDTASAYTLV